jgi:hypothetical protein
MEIFQFERTPQGIAAFVIGLAAVSLYLLGYLQEKRGAIIALNFFARILYIAQYLLLGAFSGAALDIAGAVSSVCAEKKETAFVKKHCLFVIIGANLLIVSLGLLVYRQPYDLLPIVAVLLHTGAFWLQNEKWIRIISLLGCPPWFVYNLLSGAIGSMLGDLLSFLFLLISLLRYDILPRKNAKTREG